MTDAELAAAVAARLAEREAEAIAAKDRKRIAALKRLHADVEKAYARYQGKTGGDVVAFSGSPLKPSAE